MKRRTLTVTRDAALGALLESELGARATALIAKGAVYVDGRRARDTAAHVEKGAQVTVVLEESGRAAGGPASRLELTVLHEDARVIAIDKPAGLLSQRGPSGGESALELVSKLLGRDAGLVHRLDRETSGVLLFAKTKEATRALAAAFREGRVQKRYLAIVQATLAHEGEIDLPLSRDPSRPGRWRASRTANGLAADTRWEVVRSAGGLTLVALFPKTGRTHQLRAHLAALDAPIVGDRLYGGAPLAPRCLLHAQRLTLDALTVEAPLPEDFETTLSHP